MNTYDEVYQLFIAKCKMDSYDLPTSDKAIYDLINSAVLTYNIKLGENLETDDSKEIFSYDLDGNQSLILAHCIRLIVLENQLIYFSATFSPFSKEIGTRNLGNQMNRLENLVTREEEKIDAIMLKMMDDFL